MHRRQLSFISEEKHTAAIKNEARDGVSPIIVKGWNCDITSWSSAITARSFARVLQLLHGDMLRFNRAVWRSPPAIVPEDIRDAIDIHRELAVKANSNGCVVMRSALPADLEVAGDAERAHTWVGCGSNRQMSVRSNAVTMSALATPRWASNGSGTRGIIGAGEAQRPHPTMRDLRRAPADSIGNFKK